MAITAKKNLSPWYMDDTGAEAAQLHYRLGMMTEKLTYTKTHGRGGLYLNSLSPFNLIMTVSLGVAVLKMGVV